MLDAYNTETILHVNVHPLISVSFPCILGMAGHMAPRMPATTQAAMAQLAHMAQGSRPQQPPPQQQAPPAPQPPQMIPQGLRPGLFPSQGHHQGHHPGMGGVGHPVPPGMPQDSPQPPSAITAMLGQHQRPHPPQMFRGPQPGMHPSMGAVSSAGGTGGGVRQFLPPGSQPPHMRQPGQMIGGTGAPTSQHLPMQSMRGQFAPPGYVHRLPHPHPHPHPGHRNLVMNPPREYPPGEVQIHTMPNFALSQATATQHQQQQHGPPTPANPQQNMATSIPVNPAQAALSSLAQAHTGPSPGATVVTNVGPGSKGTQQTAPPAGSSNLSAVNSSGSHGISSGNVGQSAVMATAPSTTVSSVTSASSSASNSVLPSSIAAILSQATKEQAELNAAAAAAKNQGVPTSNVSQNASAPNVPNSAAPAQMSHPQQPHGKRFPGQPTGQRMQHIPPGMPRHPGNVGPSMGQPRKPVAQNVTLLNEQPLLLEDLLEQVRFLMSCVVGSVWLSVCFSRVCRSATSNEWIFLALWISKLNEKKCQLSKTSLNLCELVMLRHRAGSVADFSFRYPASAKPYRFRDT